MNMDMDQLRTWRLPNGGHHIHEHPSGDVQMMDNEGVELTLDRDRPISIGKICAAPVDVDRWTPIAIDHVFILANRFGLDVALANGDRYKAALDQPVDVFTEYRVEWSIDISARNPKDAAQKCREVQLDPASWATRFEVHEADSDRFYIVDLLDDDHGQPLRT